MGGAALTRDLELQSERPSLLAGPILEPRILQTTETVQSGDRVHHILTLQVSTDMEFLLVEAPKPAGFELTQQESGRWISLRRVDDGDPNSPWRFRSARAYDEWRENRAVFFIDHLTEGTWEIRYTIRAESPGVYWTPPPRIESMYAPEIHAHGADFEIAVEGS